MLLLSVFFRAQLSTESYRKHWPFLTRWQAICSDVCGAFESFLEIYQAGLDELLDDIATNQVAEIGSTKKLVV